MDKPDALKDFYVFIDCALRQFTVCGQGLLARETSVVWVMTVCKRQQDHPRRRLKPALLECPVCGFVAHMEPREVAICSGLIFTIES